MAVLRVKAGSTMTDWHTAMTGWTEEGIAMAAAHEEAKRSTGIWTLNDVAGRLVSLADDASVVSDIYDIIHDDDDITEQVASAIMLGRGMTGEAVRLEDCREAASDAIDLAARCLIIVAKHSKAVDDAVGKAVLEDAVAKMAGLEETG